MEIDGAARKKIGGPARAQRGSQEGALTDEAESLGRCHSGVVVEFAGTSRSADTLMATDSYRTAQAIRLWASAVLWKEPFGAEFLTETEFRAQLSARYLLRTPRQSRFD